MKSVRKNIAAWMIHEVAFFAFFCLLLSVSESFVAQDSTDDTQLFVEQKEAGAIVISKDVTIPEDKSYTSIVVINGHVQLYGKTKNLVVVKGSVHVYSTGAVEDQLTVIEGSVSSDEGAQLPEKSTTRPNFRERMKDSWSNWMEGLKEKWPDSWSKTFNWSSEDELSKYFWLPVQWIFRIAFWMLVALASFFILLIAPNLSVFADEYFRHQLFASLFWGFLGYLSVVPTLLMMIVSIVGILFVPFYLFFAVLIFFAGLSTVLRVTGGLLLSRMGRSSRGGFSSGLSIIVGLFVYFGISMIPIVGRYIILLSMMAGVGAMVQAIFSRQSRSPDVISGV